MSKGKGELYRNRRYLSTTSRRILILVLKMITQGQACLIVLSEFQLSPITTASSSIYTSFDSVRLYNVARLLIAWFRSLKKDLEFVFVCLVRFALLLHSSKHPGCLQHMPYLFDLDPRLLNKRGTNQRVSLQLAANNTVQTLGAILPSYGAVYTTLVA